MAPAHQGLSSGSSLKVAGASTLKSTSSTGLFAKTAADGDAFADATMRLPPTGLAERPRRAVGETVWDEPVGPDDSQKKKLLSLKGRVDAMSGMFDEELAARAQQRDTMDRLHTDQLQRLDQVAAEIDSNMIELAAFVEDFKAKSTAKVQSIFADLHTDIDARLANLQPRLTALDERRRALRANLDEEKALRIRETTAVLAPLRDQLSRLQEDLDKEQNIREVRQKEMKEQLAQFVAHLDDACTTVEQSRQNRYEGTQQDLMREHTRLQRRQEETLEKVCPGSVTALEKEHEAEVESRRDGQDSIAKALTEFIKAFHLEVKEKANIV